MVAYGRDRNVPICMRCSRMGDCAEFSLMNENLGVNSKKAERFRRKGVQYKGNNGSGHFITSCPEYVSDESGAGSSSSSVGCKRTCHYGDR